MTKTKKQFIAIIFLLFVCGCTQIILPNGAKYNTLCTDKEVKRLEYIEEPNSLTIRVEYLLSDPQDLTVVMPYGGLKTKGDEK